jgi:hypothetical protein
MEAKSKRRALIRYDNRFKSVKYYTAETQSVLTSRNFHFLKPLDPSNTIPEQISITPDDVPREGESMGNTQNTMDTWNVDAEPGPLSPQKQPAEDDAEGSPYQTRGKRVNYKHLDDPFSDDETMNAEELTNLLKGNPNQPTFKQAK